MQARTLKYFLATVGILGAVACADDRTVSPTPVGPSAAIDAAAPTPAGTCDFTKMKKDARAYFALSTDVVYDLINTGSLQYKDGGSAAFLATGFQILSRVQAALATPGAINGTPAAGAAFVLDDLVCMGYTATLGDLTSALGPNGLFGVPNGTAALVSRGTPTYGVEPRGSNTWSSSLGQQVLFYGFEQGYGFSNEPPAADKAYEMKTIPAGLIFAQAIRGGVCQVIGSTPRLQHVNTILAPELPAFCGNPQSARVGGQDRGFLAFARRVSDWVAPRPLYAASMVVGGMGGALGGLSPIGAVQVDGSTVALEFIVQPSNGSINQPITPAITVSAETANGTPLDGVFITLTAFSNAGSFKLSGDTATTKGGGIATFPNFQTSKAGGYTLTASGLVGTTATQTATSVLFQVSGQQ